MKTFKQYLKESKSLKEDVNEEHLLCSYFWNPDLEHFDEDEDEPNIAVLTISGYGVGARYRGFKEPIQLIRKNITNSKEFYNLRDAMNKDCKILDKEIIAYRDKLREELHDFAMKKMDQLTKKYKFK